MAKRLNKNLVVTLTFAGMLLTTAAGVVLVKTLPQKSPKKLLEQAEAALAQKEPDYVQASQYYQRAAARAKASGDDLSANNYLIKAGDLALTAGDHLKAMALWNTVVIADPSQVIAQEKIVKFQLELAELVGSNELWGRLQPQAERLVAAAEKGKTKSYVGIHALGRSMLAQRNVKESNAEEGKKRLIEAVNGDKGNPDYARSLASYYLQEAQLLKDGDNNAVQYMKDAAAVLEAAVANAPASDPETQAKAHLYRGQLYASTKSAAVFPDADALALKNLEEAAQLAPKNEDAVIGLAMFWHAKKQAATQREAPAEEIEQLRKKARDQYEKAIKADPDHYLGYLQLAGLYLEDRRYDDALQVLDLRLGRPVNRAHYLGWRNKQYMSVVRETAFKAAMGKYTETVTAAKSADEGKAAGAPALERLKQLHKAAQAEGGEKDPLSLFMQGRLLFLQEDPWAAIKALDEAEKLTPGDSPDIQRFLAILYARIGSAGLADQALDVVLASPQYANDKGSLILRAGVKNQLKQPAEAILAAQKVLALEPGNKDALSTMSQAYLLQKNYEGAKQTQDLLNQNQGQTQKTLSQALLLRQEAFSSEPPDAGKLTAAAKLFEQILSEDPANHTALVSIVQIYGRTPEQIPEARRVLAACREKIDKMLKQVAQTQPSGSRTQDLSRLLLNIDLMGITIDPVMSPEEKIKRKEEIVRHEKDLFTQAMALGQLYRDAPGRKEDAFLQMKEAYRLKPDDPAAAEILLQLAIDRKDWKLADEVVDKAVANGIEKSGGHVYKGQILLARTDLPNNYVEAEREFRAATVEIPDFAEAYAQLGRAILAQNRLDDARAAFGKALQLNPQNVFATIGMAIIAAAQGNEAEKQNYLKRAIDVAPGNAWVQEQMQGQEEQRDPQKGIARREERRKRSPADLENLLQLADLYTRVKNAEAADKTYQAAMQIPPPNLQVVAIYARFLISKQPADLPGARSLLQNYIKGLDSKDSQRKAVAQLVYGSFLNSAGFLDEKIRPSRQEVDDAYVAAAQIDPTVSTRIEVGNYFFETRRTPDALKWYREARQAAESAANKDQRRVSHQLIMQTLLRSGQVGQYEELRKEIERYRGDFPEDAAGIMFLAEYHVTTGHDDLAIKEYNEYLIRLPDQPLGYFKRGLAHFRRSEWDAAVKDFRELKGLAPRFAGGQPRLLLAEALQQKKESDAAVAELQALAQEMPESNDAHQRLFELYMKLKRFDSAESLVNARAQQNPSSVLFDKLRSQIAMARNDFNTAARWALTAVEKSQFSPPMVDQYLVFLLQLKQFDEAIAFIEKRLPPAQHKDLVVAREGSAYAGKGDLPKALELYGMAISTPPVDLVLLTDVLNADVQWRGHEQGLQKELEGRLAKNPNDRNSKILLSVVRRIRGDFLNSAKLIRELVEAAKEDTPEQRQEKALFQRGLATVLYEAKEFKEARELYLKVLSKDAKDPVSVNNLAYLLMDQFSDPQSALAYSQQANDLIPDESSQKPSVLDTLGWNLVLLGQYDEAISRLARALEMNTRIPAVHYHIAEAFYARSLKQGSVSAGADLDQAKKEVSTAQTLLIEARIDGEHIGDKIAALASKMNVKLPAGSVAPVTQASK